MSARVGNVCCMSATDFIVCDHSDLHLHTVFNKALLFCSSPSLPFSSCHLQLVTSFAARVRMVNTGKWNYCAGQRPPVVLSPITCSGHVYFNKECNAKTKYSDLHLAPHFLPGPWAITLYNNRAVICSMSFIKGNQN